MAYGKDHKTAVRGIFMSSIEWLANIGAVVVTFFLTPIAYSHSMVWVGQFTRAYYGDELLGFVALAWGGIVVLFIYFVARMSLGTVLVMGGLAFALRFL